MILEEGKLINSRYRLLEEKGRGSFGEVWLAHDEETDIDIALKIYIALDDRGIDDFKAEFRNTYSLSHPNLLRASHFDIVDKRPFLVMPFCPGSAESLIGTTDEASIWKFILDVAKGLQYLHSKDIIHRDIKPDNILIGPDGDFLITDFGVSKRMKNTLRRNSTMAISNDNIAGTLGYFAPELFTSNPEAVKATDIWALGASLFEMTTGELPFYGQGGIMLKNGAEMPDLRGNWSRELQDTIKACMALDTWDRPTAEQLVICSNAILNGFRRNMPWFKEEMTGGEENNSVKKERSSNSLSVVLSIIFSLVGIGIAFIIGLTINSKTENRYPPKTTTQKPTPSKETPRDSSIIYNNMETMEKGAAEAAASSNSTSRYLYNRESDDANTKTVSETPAQKQQVNSVMPVVEDNATKLRNAIYSGNWSEVKRLADSGYSAACVPLAEHYLSSSSTHSLADKYAQKAKAAGRAAEAQKIIEKLIAYGYYE